MFSLPINTNIYTIMSKIRFTTGQQLKDYLESSASQLANASNLVIPVHSIEELTGIQLSIVELYQIKSRNHDPKAKILLYLETQIVAQMEIAPCVLLDYAYLI
jgi:hypothetical protein